MSLHHHHHHRRYAGVVIIVVIIVVVVVVITATIVIVIVTSPDNLTRERHKFVNKQLEEVGVEIILRVQKVEVQRLTFKCHLRWYYIMLRFDNMATDNLWHQLKLRLNIIITIN